MAIGRVRRSVVDLRTREHVGYLDTQWRRSLRFATPMDIEVGDIVEYSSDRGMTRSNGGQADILRKIYFLKNPGSTMY